MMDAARIGIDVGEKLPLEQAIAWAAREGVRIIDVQLDYGDNAVTRIDAALAEAHRVLRFGGRFFCLEFSTTQWPGFAEIYDAYSHKLVPHIGQMIAGDADSYRYLIESIRRFPPMPRFAEMIGDAGFKQVKVEPILGGLVAIHSGWKV